MGDGKIQLVQTSVACPEQYDAYLSGEKVGYLRLRHGYFSVECPDACETIVYEATPIGDGAFEEGERDYYLRFAVDAILKWVDRSFDRMSIAPNVEYELLGPAEWEKRKA